MVSTIVLLGEPAAWVQEAAAYAVPQPLALALLAASLVWAIAVLRRGE